MKVNLNQDDIDILIKLAESILVSPSIEPNLYCEQAKKAAQLVPESIRNYFLEFSKNGSPSGFLLIQSIPVLDTINTLTPPGNNCKIGEQTLISKIQAILLHTTAEMIAYEAEGYGRLFQDVVPIQSMSTIQTSLGSKIELEIHTEQAFSKLRPDVLSLACIRGDLDAYTYILPVDTIISKLSEEEIYKLREPLWFTGVDLSFKLNGHEFLEGDIRGPLAILSGEERDPVLIFDQDLMHGIDEYSNNLVQKIVDIYYANRISYKLIPGDILFIDNKRAVHGRSSFNPQYNGLDRFLIRSFAVYNYKLSERSRKNSGRVVNAIYS